MHAPAVAEQPAAAPTRWRWFSRRLGHTTVFRLALGYAGLYALITAIALAAVYESASVYIHAQIDADIKAEVGALRQLDAAHGIAAVEKALQQRSSPAARHLNHVHESAMRYYLLVDAGGHRLAGDLPAWPSAAGASTWLTYTIDSHAAVRAGLEKPRDFDADDDLRVRGLAATLPQGNRLLVVETLDEAAELTGYILASMLAAIALILIVGAAGGIWMGRHVVGRLESVRVTAADIMAGDLTRRIPVAPRRDEFNELAVTLNAMLARIEELMNGLRQVTDNVAHDLRSPLNRLRSRLEVTLLETREPAEYRAALEQAVADADGLLQTFNAMLNLAELEAGVSRERWQPVELDSLCEDVVSVYEPLAEGKAIEIVFEPAPVRVCGDRRLLAQAVGNLLDNALKYAPDGGRIGLMLQAGREQAVLTVADSGPGIAAADRQRVFERFVRLDASRSQRGNGLGLSVVRAIVHLHGGRIELSDNRPGLRVTVALPMPAAA
ncbi:MAG TPA: HAMP domain-containing sensor histidine kinase [Gammaproteobacteria bacterium]|nr:HAMP domain-containing sensor histidine kinase [Gammaproteobacteria bacterium]